MIFSNLHTHTLFCDGKNNAEDYVCNALELGFESLGFSSHAPISIENEWTMKENVILPYIGEIQRLKEKYKEKIEIYLGFEIDYLEANERYILPNIQNKIDYKIGSVHLLLNEKDGNYYTTDGPNDQFVKTITQVGGGDIKICVTRYFQELIKIIKEKPFEIIGHLDVIKKNNTNNKYFNESEHWYRDLITEVLCEVSKTDKIIEVNTGGITRGYINEPYPSYWIIKECKNMGIPIAISSDAHTVKELNGCFEEIEKELKKIGYKEHKILHNGQWKNTCL